MSTLTVNGNHPSHAPFRLHGLLLGFIHLPLIASLLAGGHVAALSVEEENLRIRDGGFFAVGSVLV